MVNAVRILVTIVVVWQVLGALATFVRVPERRFGIGSLSVAAYAVVLFGARAAEIFWLAVIPGVIAVLQALLLFEWARHSVRGRRFSYISSTDVPQFVCTDGPFRWVRHPFYTSYLMTLVSVAAMFPNRITVIGAIVGIITFHFAARHEERKFEGSPVAAEYAAYKRRTGRFVPRLGADLRAR